MKRLFFCVAAGLLAQPALAQPETAQPPPGQQQEPEEFVADVTGAEDSVFSVAVPVLATPQAADTAAGSTQQLARQIAEVIVSDLRNSRRFQPTGPSGLQAPTYPQVQAPNYGYWQGSGADNLIQGYVQANQDGTLTIGCYLYDVGGQTQLARQGFVIPPADWRRAAHRCADSIYGRLSGDTGFFDTRVVYVAETGPPGRRIKRLAMMDYDGANHRFLTNGQWTVLTPRFAPDQRTVTFMSYENERPRVWVLEMGTGRVRPLVQGPHQTFAPRYSPDSRHILFSMAVNGNTDVYRIPVAGGTPERLTNAPGIDTGGSYSPDGQRIVFESDRGGTQQIYVMAADGSNQRRISFGGGGYATPEWSPRGDLIAFTKTGSFQIGVMTPAGSGERLLTRDAGEGPTWAPNGRAIMYQRGLGRGQVWYVDVASGATRRVPTPLEGSDPSWSRLRP
ncbi:MAG TPA: Tol-Pal system beta propeller repeat protein TolB [Allosphingosinicella sp.]